MKIYFVQFILISLLNSVLTNLFHYFFSITHFTFHMFHQIDVRISMCENWPHYYHFSARTPPHRWYSSLLSLSAIPRLYLATQQVVLYVWLPMFYSVTLPAAPMTITQLIDQWVNMWKDLHAHRWRPGWIIHPGPATSSLEAWVNAGCRSKVVEGIVFVISYRHCAIITVAYIRRVYWVVQ